MKSKKLIILILLLAGIWMVGCEKYLDINEDPNGVADPSEPPLLASVTNSTGLNVFRVMNMTGNYVQYLASSSKGSDYDIYRDINGSSTWNNLYATMNNLWVIRQKAEAKNMPGYAGVADILTAFNLSMLINTWGDAPYSESFSGEFLNPKYDDQKALYDTCLHLLDAGIATLNTVAGKDVLDASSDFIYGGNIDKWIKTGYALKARLLNLVSKTDQYEPQKVLDALSHAYTGNEDDAQVTQFDGGNPWYNVGLSNAALVLGGWLSSYVIDAMNGKIYGVFDPRLPLVTDTTEDGNYRGTPNGKGFQGPTNTEHYECYLDPGKWYSSPASPLELITYSECEFTRAEANFRLGNKKEAYSAYLSGIKANMKKLDVMQDSIDYYLNNPKVGVGENNITLQLIMKEKYVACFLMTVTWDDMRRTDYNYKDFKLPFQAALPDFIRRVNYPDDEKSRNGKNVPSGIKLDDHLWWDK